MNPNILVTLPAGELRDDFFPASTRNRLESLGSVTWNRSSQDWTEDELRDRIGGVASSSPGGGARG